MKKIFLVLITTIICVSCIIKKPKDFTFLYDGAYTGIDTLIHIDGCYYNPYGNRVRMFYQDGISISSAVKDSLSIYESVTKGKGWDVHHGKSTTIYGRYIIKKDTIINQRIYYDLYWGSLAKEEKYLIIAKDKLLKINRNTENDLYEFVPLENRMDSTTWLFKKKWFYKKE